MTTRQHTRPSYEEQANVYWQQSQNELANGDLRQASEKGWGAAAQIVKAVAEQRGLPHKSHWDLFKVVDSLNSRQFNEGFGFANNLHINFYEGWLEPRQVRQYLSSVGIFIRALAETELRQA